MASSHLLVYPGSPMPITPSFASITALDADPDHASAQIQQVVDAADARDVLVFWDTRFGAVPIAQLVLFHGSLDDAWHGSQVYAHQEATDFLEYIQIGDIYRRAVPTQQGAVHWRISLRAAFVRVAIVRQLGIFNSGFTSLEGAALEMGWRWLKRGAVLRQRTDLIPPAALPVKSVAIPVTDRYRLVTLHQGRRWVRLVMLREIMRLRSPWGAWAAAQRALRFDSRYKDIPDGVADRDLSTVSLPTVPRVSVILPTFGRYRYVAEVLGDIRNQTIRPAQILIADGNPADQRDVSVYDAFRDLPLHVLLLEPHENGVSASRNACLAHITGDYVWFVDDDSRFEADNLEQHLRLLLTYAADVSVGPAVTTNRPELHRYQADIHCSFMDCGTTLCRTELIERVGGFDLQYNLWMQTEDADIGDRFIQAGGLILNNPYAQRFHYMAPSGGTRTSKRAYHRWRRWSLLARPSQTIYYRAHRYFGARAALENTLYSWILSGWRRKDGQSLTPRWLIMNLVSEIIALPLSLYRLAVSISGARAMLKQGPQIPTVKRHNAPP